MPKYKLDEKGILTIVREHNGGIFSVSSTLKIVSRILIIISIIASVTIYLFFYIEKPSSNYATDFCLDNILKKIVVKVDDDININLYCYKKLKNKAEKQIDNYVNFFDKLQEHGDCLVDVLGDKIKDKKNKWS